MLLEVGLAKRYLGAKFGYGEPIPDGVYAVPCETSKGDAFMKLVCSKDGMSDFGLYWDESLTVSWHKNFKPLFRKQSKFAKAFRNLESVCKT